MTAPAQPQYSDRDYHGNEIQRARLPLDRPVTDSNIPAIADNVDRVLWFDEDTIAFGHEGETRRVAVEAAPTTITFAYTDDGDVDTISAGSGQTITFSYENGDLSTLTPTTP